MSKKKVRGPDMEPTDVEFRIAFQALRTQAVAHGVDLSDPKVATFIQHVAEVTATNAAQNRVLYNMLHKDLHAQEDNS